MIVIKTLRLKLTTYFVALSFIVYILAALSALVFFRSVLTKSLDDRLVMLASEVGHAIDIDSETDTSNGAPPVPRLRNWQRQVTTDPARGLASAQLFDPDGKLIEAFGPDGLNTFYKRSGEVFEDGRGYRVLYTPLKWKDQIVGYVQVNTSTRSAESGVESLFITLCCLGPVVVLALGAISYYVSGIAAEPLLQNLLTTRRFIEDAGHELNTPLSIVRAKSEALERKLTAYRELQERAALENPGQVVSQDSTANQAVVEIGATLRSIGRMEKIVGDLMYLTELDTISMNERFEVIEVSTLLSQISEDFSARFAAKDVQLKVVDNVNARVRGEPDILYRAVSNLTENALRYTDKGIVEVKAHVDHDHVVITIADSGIGIPSESQGRIFERFYRVDKSRSRESGGVGLGLSIVKSIVEGHSGTIVMNSSVGKGTTFTLSLPCA